VKRRWVAVQMPTSTTDAIRCNQIKDMQVTVMTRESAVYVQRIQALVRFGIETASSVVNLIWL
jgi:hypothetical protein